jgi:hypothetical protein
MAGHRHLQGRLQLMMLIFLAGKIGRVRSEHNPKKVPIFSTFLSHFQVEYCMVIFLFIFPKNDSEAYQFRVRVNVAAIQANIRL